jgi:hypothetical protein
MTTIDTIFLNNLQQQTKDKIAKEELEVDDALSRE